MSLDYLPRDSVVSVTVDVVAPNYGRDPSGYGRKIPTRYRLRMADGRTRRVYVVCYSNSGTSYVVVNGEPAYLSSDIEHMIREA